MYRWQKPPIFPSAYASAQRSSKRRWRSIECSRSRRCSSVVSATFGGAASLSITVPLSGSFTAAEPFPSPVGAPFSLPSLSAPLSLRFCAGGRLASVLIRLPPAPAPTRDSWSEREDLIQRGGIPSPSRSRKAL